MLRSRKPIMTINVGPHSEASFSPDGRRLVVCPSAAGLVRCVRRGDGSRGVLLRENPEWRWPYAVFSPDGTRLAACGYDGIRIWDVTSASRWPSGRRNPRSCDHLAFSPDGKHLARAGWGGIAEVWDTATGRKVQTFKGHSGGIQAIAFSPDGTRLATGGADGTVRLWDIAQSGDGAAISLPESEMRWGVADLSPDGRSLLVFAHGQASSCGTPRHAGCAAARSSRRGVQQPPKLERRRRTYVPGGLWKGRGVQGSRRRDGVGEGRRSVQRQRRRGGLPLCAEPRREMVCLRRAGTHDPGPGRPRRRSKPGRSRGSATTCRL